MGIASVWLDILEQNCVSRHCWVDVWNWRKGWAVKSFCVADEHYIPSLLASLGLSNETDCRVRIWPTQASLLVWPAAWVAQDAADTVDVGAY